MLATAPTTPRAHATAAAGGARSLLLGASLSLCVCICLCLLAAIPHNAALASPQSETFTPEIIVNNSELLFVVAPNKTLSPGGMLSQLVSMEERIEMLSAALNASLEMVEERLEMKLRDVNDLATATDDAVMTLTETVTGHGSEISAAVRDLESTSDVVDGLHGMVENLNDLTTGHDVRIGTLEGDIEHLPAVIECAEENKLYSPMLDMCVPSQGQSCEMDDLSGAYAGMHASPSPVECSTLFGGFGCVIRCDEGYEGDRQIATCLANGTFSTPEISCTKKQCSDAPNSGGAMVSCTDSNFFESVCSYSCEGFVVGGLDELTCGADQQWTPFGEELQCSDLRPWIVDGNQARLPKEEEGPFTGQSCPTYFVGGDVYSHGGINFQTGPFKNGDHFAVVPNERVVEVIPPRRASRVHYLVSGGRSTGFSFVITFHYNDGATSTTDRASISWDCEASASGTGDISITHLGGYGGHGCCDQWWRLYATPHQDKELAGVQFSWSGGATDIFAITLED